MVLLTFTKSAAEEMPFGESNSSFAGNYRTYKVDPYDLYIINGCSNLPSMKLTANAPENPWLEDEIPFGARPSFRGELLVSGRVNLITLINSVK